MPTVRIPTPLRKLTQGKEEVVAAGGTVGEVLASLETNFPGLRAKICDEIAIVPAIAGGSAGEMARGKYYLTFPKELADQPVICDMYDHLGVRFSIRQAQVSDEDAILGVELTGSEDRLMRAVDYLTSRGVRVEPIGLVHL